LFTFWRSFFVKKNFMLSENKISKIQRASSTTQVIPGFHNQIHLSSRSSKERLLPAKDF
jgi:hypothetical protein